MTPLETCRAKMQKIHAQLSNLAAVGCSTPAEAKEKSEELLQQLYPLMDEQRRLSDFSGVLSGAGDVFPSAFGGGDHVPLRVFRGPDAHARAHAVGQWCKWRLLRDEGARAWCEAHPELLGAASESINTAGGFLVPDPLSRAIIDVRQQHGVARRECDIWPMDSEAMDIPKKIGGVTAYYVGESVEIKDSAMSWGLVSLGAKKLGALSRLSSEVSDDAIINLAERVGEAIGEAFAEAEDDALFNGNGTSTYGGIYGILPKIIDGTHNAGMIAAPTAAHDTFAELDSADLLAAMLSLPEEFEKGAKWYTSGYAWGAVFCRLLMAASGNSMINLSEGIKRAFMGYEVVSSPKMPHGAATDYTGLPMILFGNMRKAAIFGSRRETRLKVDGSRYLEFDQVAVLGTERYDINCHELGDNATAGALVALVGGSG